VDPQQRPVRRRAPLRQGHPRPNNLMRFLSDCDNGDDLSSIEFGHPAIAQAIPLGAVPAPSP
jgi:hypothetical protein